jgi:CheY-like chemotaxis protein
VAQNGSREGSTTTDNGVVLIVDDHVLVARSLVSLCSASGFDALAVHSGAAALEFLRSNAAVALVLLDLSMPDMSGVDVLRTIRAAGDAHFASLPVVMFSADDDRATRDALTQLGATGFISKMNPSGLLRLVAAYVGPGKPRRA